jgi:hypothetical protein
MGRKVDGLKDALKNATGKTANGETIGEVLEDFNIQYINVSLTIAVKDSEGGVIEAPTIVLKKGAVVGSGDTITAEADGAYKVVTGSYNYSVSKEGYVTATGVFEIVKAQLETMVVKAITLEIDA